jgi:hypothetical protein
MTQVEIDQAKTQIAANQMTPKADFNVNFPGKPTE